MRLNAIKGQALFFVIFLLIIVGILGTALLHMWESEVQIPSLQKYSLQAFYLAQAGIERAKVEIINRVDLDGWCPGAANCPLPANPGDIWYTDLDDDPATGYGFIYRFNVTGFGVAPLDERTISAEGVVLDDTGTGTLGLGTSGNEVGHREIEVTIDDIDDQFDNTLPIPPGTPPPDGIDDDNSGTPVDWSWHEI